MKWFKFHSEFKSDPKIKRLPIAHRYAFIVLMCLANEGEGDQWGKINLDDEDIAFDLEMTEEDWLTLKAKFKAKGFIDFEQGTITIRNWNKRQERKPSDQPEAVKARVAKHRASKKDEPVTPCNALQGVCNATDQIREDLEEIRREGDLDPEAPTQTANFAVATENPIADPKPKAIAPPIKPEPKSQPVQKISDQDSPVAENSEERIKYCEFEVLSSAIVPADHPLSKTEAHYKADPVERPWKLNQEVRGLFLKYLANTRKGEKETYAYAHRINTCMVRKADYRVAVPGTKDYDQVWDAWQEFQANAETSENLAQVTGENEVLNNIKAASMARIAKISSDLASRKENQNAV
jgi:hypothetical protein